MAMTILAVCGPIGSDFKEFSEQCYSLVNEERTLLIDRSSYDSTESLFSAIEKEKSDIIIFGTDIFLDATLRARFDIKVFLELDAELSLISHLRTSAANDDNVGERLKYYQEVIKPLNEEIRLSSRHADLRRPQASENATLIGLLINEKEKTLMKCPAPSFSQSKEVLWASAHRQTKDNDETTLLDISNLTL